jgi:UTP--glucose-1-phosphate uridylyltransferase
MTLADSINQLAQDDEVYGKFIQGIWHDTGDQLKYLKAVVDTALVHPKLAEDFRDYLESRLKSENV